MKFQAVRGTKDILPIEARAWQKLEDIARRLFGVYGYSEIRTPVIEDTALFERSVGETTDIVEKEMYTFEDRGERKISLRPEETAPVVRAYLEAGLHKTQGFVKLYYIGPMFRAERPQAGRQRQFHQIGVEVIGSDSVYADAESLQLLMHILSETGLKKHSLVLNSLGCAKDREKLSQVLQKNLKTQEATLCEDCKRRISRNVFRVFDCKKDSCRAAVRKMPTMLEHLCNDCSAHFEALKKILDSKGVKYAVNPHLVRGLDYYTRTAFEVTHEGLGAQNAIGAGGRYDNLVEEFGGPKLGAIGFALGVERLLLALETEGVNIADKQRTALFIASIGEEACKKGFDLLAAVRKGGISADMDYENRSLKGQLRRASDLNVKFVAILGEDELKKNAVTLKDMDKGTQQEVNFSKLSEMLKNAADT
ncbi:MAG: histidine--tRNA ligase [Candidatus Omnitrophota bacterium]